MTPTTSNLQLENVKIRLCIGVTCVGSPASPRLRAQRGVWTTWPVCGWSSLGGCSRGSPAGLQADRERWRHLVDRGANNMDLELPPRACIPPPANHVAVYIHGCPTCHRFIILTDYTFVWKWHNYHMNSGDISYRWTQIIFKVQVYVRHLKEFAPDVS